MFLLNEVKYDTQYSEMYRSRSRALGERLNRYLEESGLKREHDVPGTQKTFLVGCIVVEGKKPQIIKEIKHVKNIEKSGWAMEDPSYFIEDTEMERVWLDVSKCEGDRLVNGCVVAVFGTKEGKGVRVERVFFPIETYKAGEDRKKVRFGREKTVVVPRIGDHRRVTAKKIADFVSENGAGLVLYEETQSCKHMGDVEAHVVPGENDHVLHMLPYQPPARRQIGAGPRHTLLTNPASMEISGKTVIFCNYRSVEEVLRYAPAEEREAAGAEKYFGALHLLLRCMHISPCSPDSCPTYPMSEDPFVLKDIPDMLIVRVEEKVADIREVEEQGKRVFLVVLSVAENGVLVISEGVPSIETI